MHVTFSSILVSPKFNFTKYVSRNKHIVDFREAFKKRDYILTNLISMPINAIILPCLSSLNSL